MQEQHYDIFLSHNNKEKVLVKELDGRLRDEAGISPWLDAWLIQTGSDWEKEIESALNTCNAFAVFLGEHGWSKYHLKESLVAIERYKTDSKYRIIPILLPGAKDADFANSEELFTRLRLLLPDGKHSDFSELVKLFISKQRVDFRVRDGIDDDEAFQRLTSGIRGELPFPEGRVNASTLRRDARQWIEKGKRDKTILYGGTRLREAQKIASETPERLNKQAIQFLSESAIEEVRRQRRTTIGLALGFVTLSVFCIAAVIASIVAAIQRNQAISKENARATAQANAENQTRVAIANEIAAYSDASLRDFPQRSLLLAIEAMRINQNYGEEPQLPAQQALRTALENYQGMGIGKHRFSVNNSAISPDGQWYVTVSNDGQAFLWKLRTEKLLEPAITLNAHTRGVRSLSFSPDSRWLITGGNDGMIIGWNLTAESVENSAKVLLQDDSCDGKLENAPPLAPITSDDQGYVYCYVSHLGFAPNGKWLIADYGTSQGETLVSWAYSNQVFSRQATMLTSIGSSEPQPGLEPIYYYNWVKAFAFNSERNWLAVSYGYGGVELWKFDNEVSNYEFLNNYLINDLVFSNNAMIASTESGDILYWGITDTGISAEPIKFFSNENQSISKLLISEDQKWLVGISGVDIFVWDLQDLTKNPQTLIGSHEKAIISAEILQNGQWLITGSDDHIIKVWSLSETMESSLYLLKGHDAAITTLTSTSDSKWLFSGDQNGSVHFWDLSAPNRFLSTPIPSVLIAGDDYLTSVAISSDANLLVAGGFSGNMYFWNLNSDNAKKVKELYGNVYQLRFSPDNRWIVSASSDGSVSIWDSQSIQNPPDTIFISPEAPFEISPNGQWIAVIEADNSVSIYQLGGTYNIPVAKIKNSDLVTSLAWSPDSDLLAYVCQNQTLQIWNTKDLPNVEQTDVISPIFDAIEARVKFSPTGNWLIFSDLEGLYIWRIDNEKLSGKPVILSDNSTTVTKLATSNDGRWLVSASGPKSLDFLYEKDLTIRVWDLYSSDPSLSVVELNTLEEDILDATISPNGKWVAATSKDNKIYLWNMDTINFNSSPQIFNYHTDWVNDIEFAADSNFLLSASADGTVRIWELDFDKMILQACEIVGRNLSKKEWNEYFPNEDHRTTCSQWIAEE